MPVSGSITAGMKNVKREITPEEVKAARATLDLTQEELARRMGISVYAVRKWETGQAQPSRGLYRNAILAVLAEAKAAEKG